MALNAYLRTVGETQGKIMGSVDLPGRRGAIEVIATDHEVFQPHDRASGRPTGERQHRPLTITKAIDRSSPLLMNALTTNENLSDWRLDYYRLNRAGKEVPYYTIELENARITGIRQEMLNNKYPENLKHEVREHVQFNYQKVIWTFLDGGITAEDDWETPVA